MARPILQNAGKGGGDVNDHNHCVHEDDFRRLESLIVQVFTKMDAFISDLRQVAVGDAKYQERVETLRRDVDTLFTRARTTSDKIDEINQWKNELRGSVKVWIAVPSILATILALLNIVKFLNQ